LGEVALFIDLENISTSMWKNFQQSPDPFELVKKAASYGPISFARAYGDFSQPPLQRLESDLRAAGIDKFDCPTKQRDEGETQSTVDANIMIDLFEVALDRPGIKTFVLAAGDRDYVRVVARLRHRLLKDVVIAGVPGSVSRELARAANSVDPIQPVEAREVDETALIQIIDRYEMSLPDGVYPTFGRMLPYVADPRNSHVISPQLVQQKLNDLVQRGILIQEQMVLGDGRELRVTRLNHDDPLVADALGLEDDFEDDGDEGDAQDYAAGVAAVPGERA
jgi:uncharacterized LabA/DUF88 family protein